MPELASSAAVAALYLALALGALGSMLTSRYRACGILAGACALRGIAYAMRAAYAPGSPASVTLAWWTLTTAGLGLAVCANSAVLASWFRNARAASKPPRAKTWGAASQGIMFAALVAGPVLAVASAGLAHGGRLEETLEMAARVKAASVWATLAVAALAALQTAAATFTCILGIFAAPPAAAPKPRAATYSSTGGGGGTVSSSGGGTVRSSGGGSSRSSRLSISHHDPERGLAEPIDLGQPIAIIATVEEEEEEEAAAVAATGGAATDRVSAGPGVGSAAAAEAGGSEGGVRAAAAAAVAAALGGGGSSSGGGSATEAKVPLPHLQQQRQPVVTIPLPPPLDIRADRWVTLLLVCSGLLVLSAAVRGVALISATLWASDRELLLLVALPELLAALLLVAPPKMMARIGMASRYARWQPQKGKPPTSRPKNSNPAIWRRAGQPAPASRTHTQSEGGV